MTPAFRGGTASIEVFAHDAVRDCLKTQNLENVVPHFSFPGSAWECMTWRLCLHYRPECQIVIPLRGQRSDMPLVGARPRVRPGNGQTHRSAPTVAATLPFEVEFVSSLRKRIGITGQSPEDMGSQAEPGNQEPRLLPKDLIYLIRRASRP